MTRECGLDNTWAGGRGAHIIRPDPARISGRRTPIRRTLSRTQRRRCSRRLIGTRKPGVRATGRRTHQDRRHGFEKVIVGRGRGDGRLDGRVVLIHDESRSAYACARAWVRTLELGRVGGRVRGL